MSSNWNLENDKIIEDLFNRFLAGSAEERVDAAMESGVEFIITSACNQKCEYCYLAKNGDKLYPSEIRDEKTIIQNLHLILNYFLEQKYYPISFDLFSGEIWSTKLGYSVLYEILEYVKKCPEPPRTLCIPSNCSFILNDKVVETLEYFIKSFDYYGTRMFFSASIDGPLLEETNRSFIDTKKNKDRNDNFYDKIFKWCKKQNFGFHPMVNAHSIEKWPAQFDWWLDKFEKYEFDYWDHIMFLEVRNNEWTDEKIQSYLSFLNHCFEETFSRIMNNDIQLLLREGLKIKNLYLDSNYNHLFVGRQSVKQGCNVDRLIILRLGDLAWVPCHRTSYEKFIYGKAKVENEKIVGMEALNLPLLFSIYGMGYKGHPKCDICPIGDYCMRGCYGAQYEEHKELFYPCDTVCNLFKAKLIFLYEKYNSYANKYNIIDSDIKERLAQIKEIVDNMDKEDKEKWYPIIQPLI